MAPWWQSLRCSKPSVLGADADSFLGQRQPLLLRSTFPATHTAWGLEVAAARAGCSPPDPGPPEQRRPRCSSRLTQGLSESPWDKTCSHKTTRVPDTSPKSRDFSVRLIECRKKCGKGGSLQRTVLNKLAI